MTTNREAIAKFYDARVDQIDLGRKRHAYYHRQVRRLISAAAPEAKSVLLLGCGTGDTLAELKPHRGVGVDISPGLVARASARHPEYDFLAADANSLAIEETFDLIAAENLVGESDDLWTLFRNARSLAHDRTRLVVVYYSRLWEPAFVVARMLGLHLKRPVQNWIPIAEIENILDVTGWEPVRAGHRCLLPVRIPVLSDLVNRWIAPLPPFRNLGLISFLYARAQAQPFRPQDEYTVTVVVPCRNDAGRVEELVRRTPRMGRHTEILFADGGSDDGTPAVVRDVGRKYKGERDVLLIEASGDPEKGDALQRAFDAAQGDILMTLDSNASVAPEDLPKFYYALAEGRCDFVNGSRLVYATSTAKMRPLDLVANHLFARAFSFVLSARLRDILCGTKAFFRKDWPGIRTRALESPDPFDDFDLLLGAAELGLKIGEIPIHYHERTSRGGFSRRFHRGMLLLERLYRSARGYFFV